MDTCQEKELYDMVNEQLNAGFSKSEIIKNLSANGYEIQPIKRVFKEKNKKTYSSNIKKTILTILTWCVVVIILTLAFRTQDDKKISFLPLTLGVIFASYVTEKIWKSHSKEM